MTDAQDTVFPPPSLPAEPAFRIEGDRAKLFGSLAKARKAFKPIVRSKTVKVTPLNSPAYTFTYAPLESIQDATTEALSDNGLVLFDAVYSVGIHFEIRTILAHESGAFIESIVGISGEVYMKDGNARPLKNQELGSEITYKRRYAAGCLLGVSPEDDDDGNAADGHHSETVQRAPRQQPSRQQPPRPAPPPKPEPEPAPQAKPEEPARKLQSVPPPPVESWDPAPTAADTSPLRYGNGEKQPILGTLATIAADAVKRGIVAAGKEQEVFSEMAGKPTKSFTVGDARLVIRKLLELGANVA